jgi:hypothetical protein
MANTDRRDPDDTRAADAQREQPGQQFHDAPAVYGGPTRVNTSGLHLSIRIHRFPEDLIPGGYFDRTLAELLMIYECLKVHPAFIDKKFDNLQDGIEHLMKELTRLCGMHHTLSYDDYECFEWENRNKIKMPASLSLVGQSNNVVFIGEKIIILELWPISHEFDPVKRLVMISACAIMYHSIGIPFFNDSGFAPIHMEDKDFINWDLDHAVHYEVDRFSPQYQKQLADYNRKKEQILRMAEEYKVYSQIKEEIINANLTASVRVVNDYIRKGDDAGLIEWLSHVIRIHRAGFDIRMWAPIYPIVGAKDVRPINDFTKIGMYYRWEWPLVDITRSVGAQIENDHGHVPLINGTILTPTGYRLPKQELVPVLESLGQLLNFQLNTSTYPNGQSTDDEQVEAEIEITV